MFSQAIITQNKNPVRTFKLHCTFWPVGLYSLVSLLLVHCQRKRLLCVSSLVGTTKKPIVPSCHVIVLGAAQNKNVDSKRCACDHCDVTGLAPEIANSGLVARLPPVKPILPTKLPKHNRRRGLNINLSISSFRCPRKR